MDNPSLPVIPRIEELNNMPAEAFEVSLRPLFEVARPLADALYARRPFRSYSDLLDQTEAIMVGLSDVDQVEVINSHPRIGQRTALSTLSAREQGPPEDESVYRELERLNQLYEERFGFRFVVFVNGRSRQVIAGVLAERLRHSREIERQTAWHEMLVIARDRLRRIEESAVA